MVGLSPAVRELTRFTAFHQRPDTSAESRTEGAPFDGDFPVREISFASGDRFLLYTDGFSEPENAQGEAFGDRKLEQILRDNSSRPAAELSLLLLDEARKWQPAALPQQDDITLLIIDVL